MKKYILPIFLFLTVIVFSGCRSRGFSIYQYDNGDDYICEGVRRIVDKSGKIGFADAECNVVIRPVYAFAFPFENGMAKATYEGESVAEGEYHRWVSPDWFYIDHNGDIVDWPAVMEAELKEYISGKDARIGIAVIVNGKDTISVNGNRDFPMLSVYKFPQALAVADYCLRRNVSLADTISIEAEEIKTGTWSPMREKYGTGRLRIPLSELLACSVQQSDNNACDILFRLIGGTHVADSLMKTMGFDGIIISSTEEEMHMDTGLCYLNRSTPLEMARLFDRFYRLEMRHDSPVCEAIGKMMITCETGANRLPAPLMPTNAVIGHKTGTGDRNSQGRIIGVNDAGYVFMPDGGGYSIAVFIADSACGMAETEKMIADISEIVFLAMAGRRRS